MGVCIEKIACPDCGSSDGLQTFYDDEKDRHYGICFAGCGIEYKGNPYKEGEGPVVEKKSPEEIQEEIRDVQSCKIFTGIDKTGLYRGIPVNYFRSWGVRLLNSEYDGKTPYAVGFPYSDEGELTGWKIRPFIKKSFFSIGDAKGSDPFGLERALRIGGKRLWITEGEFDAIALDYCLVATQKDTKYAKKMYPVISLTSGGGSITTNLKKIRKRVKNKFEEIVLVLDNDKIGLKAEKDAQALWPEILVVDKPKGCKDANDAVIKGLVEEMGHSAYWEAHKLPIEGVVRVSSVLSRAVEKPPIGLSYPLPSFNDITLGQRWAEAVCLGAGVGLGKTVIAHKFAAHNMVEHREPCFLALLEEENHYTVKNIAAKIDSIPYSDPRIEYDQDQLIATAESLEDYLYMWESSGDQALRFDMDEIISAIRFNRLEYGCRFAYIDNWTRLVDHLEASKANEFINKYSSEIENLATQLDMHIMTFTHLNAPKFGPSHEEGAEVFANQFTGSKGIMRSFPQLMSFRRNKHADETKGMNKNNSILSLIKSRKYGNESSVKTQYIPSTGQLIENEWHGELLNEQVKRR